LAPESLRATALSFARNRATWAVDGTGARAPPGWPGSDGGV